MGRLIILFLCFLGISVGYATQTDTSIAFANHSQVTSEMALHSETIPTNYLSVVEKPTCAQFACPNCGNYTYKPGQYCKTCHYPDVRQGPY